MMRERQRQLAEQGDSVIEGRDIGEIVAPHAELEDLALRRPRGARGAPARRAGRDGGRGARRRDAPPRRARRRRTPIAPTTRSSSTRRSSTSSRSIDRIEGARRRSGSRERDEHDADKVWAVGRPTIGTAVKARRRGMKVYGKERVPLTGGLVIACNHFRWIDPPALGAPARARSTSWPRSRRTACPGSAAFIRAFGTFPVRRGESDRDAVRTMRAIVRDGLALGLFAEGTRQRSGVPGAAAARSRDGRAAGGRAGDPGRDPRLADRGSRQPPDLARLGRADPLRGAAQGRQGLQGGVGDPAGEDPRALRLPRRDARARSPGRDSRRDEPTTSSSRRRSRRRARSPAPSRSSASRTSASRR